MDYLIELFENSPIDQEKLEAVNGNNNIQPALPPEPQEGHIEYKLMLVNITRSRFEHLVSQMKWRLREGGGEAIYEIGVKDDGTMIGITRTAMKTSINNLMEMAKKLGALVKILRMNEVKDNRLVAEVLVRKLSEDLNMSEVRICLLGNAGAGKSTITGVLTTGCLDNGSGSARLNVFRHLHEIRTGRTSSISQYFLGFTEEGEAIHHDITSECIYDAVSKIITLFDLAGDKRYIRTTIQGLSGYNPHHAMLVISAISGPTDMTREHLSLMLALRVSFFIVITKSDKIKSSVDALHAVENFLSNEGVKKLPFLVDTMDKAIIASSNMNKSNIIPIFIISNVTGCGLPILQKFLFLLPLEMNTNNTKLLEEQSPLFQIDEHFRAGNINQVLVGLLVKGVIMENSDVQIGPFANGTFMKVKVSTLHRNRVSCAIAKAGQCASLVLDQQVPGLRNGMVLVGCKDVVYGCMFFKASIRVIHHPTAISTGYETTLFIGNIRQTAVVVAILNKTTKVRNNESAIVIFKFKQQCEYLNLEQPLLFKEGNSKGVGVVLRTYPIVS